MGLENGLFQQNKCKEEQENNVENDGIIIWTLELKRKNGLNKKII